MKQSIKKNIHLAPCAYLHNYREDDVIKNNFYQPYIERAPLFLKGKDEKEKLQTFIKSFVRYGNKSKLMFRIENGKIKPSKSLADSLAKMIAGNPEFIMLDEQKLVYETAIKLAKESSPTNKNILIVQGGPGTGKSVVVVKKNGLIEPAYFAGRRTLTRSVPTTTVPSNPPSCAALR
jgi:hypothetical protein